MTQISGLFSFSLALTAHKPCHCGKRIKFAFSFFGTLVCFVTEADKTQAQRCLSYTETLLEF